MSGLDRVMARLVLACLPFLPATGAGAQEAHFSVTQQVVNPDLPAFTATVASFGNGTGLTNGGGGFEPTVFRNMLVAEADSPDAVLAAPAAISGWDSWPEGALDGADIEVLRIVNGAFVSVRRDKIAEHGFHASGWGAMIPGGKILSPDRTRYAAAWDGWNRRDAPYYYTVRAVDSAGNLSEPSNVVSVMPPPKPGSVSEAQPCIDKKLTGQPAPGLAAPTALTGRVALDQTLLLSWNPVPGAAGYAVFRADLPPERLRGYSMQLAGQGAPIQKGDLIFVRKKFYAPTRAQVATNRIWSANSVDSAFGIPLVNGMAGDPGMPEISLLPHPADTPVTDPGETYLHVVLSGGKTLAIGNYNFSGTWQEFYPVLDPDKTYRFEVWLRGTGKVFAKFDSAGVFPSMSGLPASFDPGPQWKKYTVDFRPPFLASKGGAVGRMTLSLSGDGTVDVDNFRIYRADAPFLHLVPEDRAALAASGMSLLRTHMFIKTGTSTYDLAELTNAGGGNAHSEGQTLPQVLANISAVGADPWLQIEMHFSPEEWQGLVEYLAAPFDPAHDDPKKLPWAAKRVAQGHPAPWIDDFHQIYFEIGNETWNGLFRPWVFPALSERGLLKSTDYSPGAVYGLYQEYVLSLMRKSPWWDRLGPKLEPVLGGWLPMDYGVQALQKSPSSRFLTRVEYIGGWDAGEGPVRDTPAGYASVMAFAPQVSAPNSAMVRDQVRRLMPGRQVGLGTYESGPGFAMSGLNGQQVTPEQQKTQERVMKSAASGAATLDTFLSNAMAGDRLQNYFLFARGDYWSSHAKWNHGGQAFPAWDWMTVFNHQGTGDLLAVETQTVPTQPVPQMGRRKAMDAVPMAAVYATRKGDRLTVTVISREVPDIPAGNAGQISVAVDLPITGAASLTRYRASGDYRADNVASQETRIVSDALPVPADAAHLRIPDMPPASAEVYVYEGVTFAK